MHEIIHSTLYITVPSSQQDFLLDAIKLFFSTLLHDEINLDKAKGGQQQPLKDFTVQNDCFNSHFSKDFEVASKHTYRRHIFLAWFQVLNWSCSFCVRPCPLGLQVNAWCGVVVVPQ